MTLVRGEGLFRRLLQGQGGGEYEVNSWMNMK